MADIKTWGCHNKPTHKSYLVQDGYYLDPVVVGEDEPSEYRMTPRFIKIVNPHDDVCHYDNVNADWRCRGCNRNHFKG